LRSCSRAGRMHGGNNRLETSNDRDVFCTSAMSQWAERETERERE
jgi:hypothetical protein